MEVFIICAVSLIGYELSRKSSTQNIQNNQSMQNNNFIKNNIEPKRVNRPIVQQQQMSHYEPVPFFKSEKSQNTNDSLKDNRLSTFTGIDNVDFIHKKETETPFNPTPDLTNVNGSRNTLDYELSHYNTSHLHNNSLPFTQEKVGRGLGIKSDVAAGGGFHDSFRILPDNVNAYRKHTYENRVVRGVSHVTNRHSDINVAKNIDNVTCITRDQFPIDSATTFKQSARSNQEQQLRFSNRGNQNCNSGVLTGNNLHSVQNESDYTRDIDYSKTNPVLNVKGTTSIGGYSNASYLTHDNQSLCTPSELNLSVQNKENYVNPTDDLNRLTTRGDINTSEGYINSATHGLPSYNYDVNNTQRHDLHSSYTGGLSSNVKQQTARDDCPSNTQRDTACMSMGPASSYLPTSSQYNPVIYNIEQHQQRELVSSGYTPGAGRMNFQLDSKEVISTDNLNKLDNNNTDYVPVATIKDDYNFKSKNTLGIVHIPQKLPQTNRRLQLSIAKEQLKNNELHININ